MKSKVSFTIDTDVIRRFKKQRVLHHAQNESQFIEWILRQVLWKPKALLRLKARSHAQQLAFIQEQIADYEEKPIEDTIDEVKQHKDLCDC